MTQRMFSLTLAGLLIVLAGCGGTGGGAVVTEREPDYSEPASGAAPPQPPADKAAPYADLLTRATAAREAGYYEEALILLERAQRIDSASAEIYLALAQTHYAKGDVSQAQATAERGMLYCQQELQCAALQHFVR